MNRETIKGIMIAISKEISENRDYLVELDQVNGDGDLGISMDDGYQALVQHLEETEETDLGKIMMSCGKVFNTSAPSSLGTITSFGFMGMAKKLKGKENVTFKEGAKALFAGVENIMVKAESEVGEKTIVDSLYPAAKALLEYEGDKKGAIIHAFEVAKAGSEATRQMKAVHGRAVYSSERSIGILDGGSVVGMLIFKGIKEYYLNQED